MKWSPWPGGATKRFHVKVSQLKLQGFNFEKEKDRVGVIEVNWKGESTEQKSNMVVFGTVSLNLAELASTMESQIRRKLSVTLKMEGTTASEATLLESNSTAEYSSQSDHELGNCTTSRWEEREVESRDGQAKLTTNVFFASFDQRNEKAAGESACTALVAVITHWLHLHQHLMPTRSKFDSLITQGSSEWQKLCSKETYINLFSNKHFDLETILEADLRPLYVSPEKSFIGFFRPDKFESLKGLMSFDDIWNEINKNTKSYEPRIYIVSWNDHFFVLKIEADAYYIMDSLGERLFEGCNQAYILKFDDSSIMHGKTKKVEDDSEERLEVICSGKECCRQFIKRFLAAIPLKGLEEEEKKSAASILPLHRHLQIEFHYTSSSSSSSSSSLSSSSSSSLSTSSTSTYSLLR